jgi:hypothetical protein
MLYKKIHIHVKRSVDKEWTYACSTNWSKTCKEAKAFYLLKFPQLSPNQVKTNWAKD